MRPPRHLLGLMILALSLLLNDHLHADEAPPAEVSFQLVESRDGIPGLIAAFYVKSDAKSVFAIVSSPSSIPVLFSTVSAVEPRVGLLWKTNA